MIQTHHSTQKKGVIKGWVRKTYSKHGHRLLLCKFGDQAKAFIERRLTIVFTLIIINLVVEIIMIKFI